MQSLIREHEQIRMADMNAVAFSTEPKKLEHYRQDWRKRALVSESIDAETIRQMSREADDIIAQYKRAHSKGLVS